MKIRYLAILPLMTISGLYVNTASAADIGFEDSIEDVASGIGRFRFGKYISGSLGSSPYETFESTTDQVKVYGIGVEAGLYVLFNAIRDTADMELGINVSHMFSSEIDKDNIKSSELTSLNLYGGFVFHLESKSAVAVGAITQIGKGRAKTAFEVDASGESLDTSKGLGFYIEYQFKPDVKDRLFFVRLQHVITTFENSDKSLEAGISKFSVGYKF